MRLPIGWCSKGHGVGMRGSGPQGDEIVNSKMGWWMKMERAKGDETKREQGAGSREQGAESREQEQEG